MRNCLRLICLPLLLVAPVFGFCQYYNLGQDPASIKWRLISTDHFRLIYPENYEYKAQQMMSTFSFAYLNETRTLNYKPKQIPFIIHNYNIEPNAVTVWAPKRVEIFTSPPQDSYAQDWLDQLILHEYRHVIQMDRANQGFTKVLSWFAGEQGTAMINGLFVPPWFLEGDAVCTETALSLSGRGRLPGFEMLLRTQVEEKGSYSYDKAVLGSYRNFVPNQYSLGYTLVANIRRKYGYQAWNEALDAVARRPFILNPFNYGLKKATGKGKEGLYRMTMLEMDSLWKYQNSQIRKTTFRELTENSKKKYENYKFPFYINDSVIVAEYSSLDDITSFVEIGPGKEKQIFTTPGFLSAEPYSALITHTGSFDSEKRSSAKRLIIVWTESINDYRWGERSFSDIRVFDVMTGKTSNLTQRGRYFAPAVSPVGDRLAAIKVDQEGRSSVVLIDMESGKELDTIISSFSDFYMTPSWSDDGKRLAFTKLGRNGKSIIVFDFNSRAIRTYVEPTFTEISNPVFAKKYILFNGAYSGIENIYAVDTADFAVFQVTSAEFGACNADLSPGGGKIVYSNYTSDGYGLAETNFNPPSWKPISGVKDYSPSLYKYLAAEESCVLPQEKDTTTVYISEVYKKSKHIFNFHSWAPVYINYMDGVNGAGISAMSQNDLSTATTVVGYKYDMQERTGKVTLDFSLKAWYPVIDLKSSYGTRAGYADSTLQRYTFNETVISGGLTLPLIFTGGKFYQGLRIQTYTSWINITNNSSPLENKRTGSIHTIDYNLYFYNFIKQAYKDLYPRWGQSLSFAYRHSPFGDNDLGEIASVESRIYVPGIFRHHGVRLDFTWQMINSGNYSYNNQVNLPRGYFSLYEKSLYFFALNYKFPFAYPDFPLGRFIYFKRFKANLFYDRGEAKTHGVSQKLESTGVEITSDLHLLRFPFPMDLGFRLGYLPQGKHYFTNLLFSVNL